MLFAHRPYKGIWETIIFRRLFSNIIINYYSHQKIFHRDGVCVCEVITTSTQIDRDAI